MGKFTFVAIKEKEVSVQKFKFLETCTNLLKLQIEREEQTRKHFGIKDKRYMCITDDTGRIIEEWKDKD